MARKGVAPISQVAKDFGISETCLQRWLRIADRDDGAARLKTGASGGDEAAELREARKRIQLLEQENEILRKTAGYLAQSSSLPK